MSEREKRHGEHNDIPLSEKYYIRYVAAEQTRDETLGKMLTTVSERERRSYQELLDMQSDGVQISDPDFVAENKQKILATVGVFRLDLNRSYTQTLFDRLLEALDPENRTDTLLPIQGSPIITSTSAGPGSQDFLSMYTQADKETLAAILSSFTPEPAIGTFLGALEDGIPLLPHLPHGAENIWVKGGNRKSGQQIVSVGTKLMGVNVEYRLNGILAPNLSRTTIVVNTLR